MAKNKKDNYEGFVQDELEGKKPVKKIYYSYHQKQGFKVPVKVDGKVIMKTVYGSDKLEIVNGKPIPLYKDINFKTQSNNIKRGCLSYYETEDTDEIEILDALSLDPSTEIMTEEMYLKEKDPTKYEIEKELKAQKDENIALKSALENKDDVIAQLNKRLAELQGENV